MATVTLQRRSDLGNRLRRFQSQIFECLKLARVCYGALRTEGAKLMNHSHLHDGLHVHIHYCNSHCRGYSCSCRSSRLSSSKKQSDRKGNMQPNEIAANVIVRLPAVVANNVCWLWLLHAHMSDALWWCAKELPSQFVWLMSVLREVFLIFFFKHFYDFCPVTGKKKNK